MEELSEFLGSLAAAIMFCIALWLLFLQLKSLPGGIFPNEINRFEVIYVSEDY